MVEIVSMETTSLSMFCFCGEIYTQNIDSAHLLKYCSRCGEILPLHTSFCLSDGSRGGNTVTKTKRSAWCYTCKNYGNTQNNKYRTRAQHAEYRESREFATMLTRDKIITDGVLERFNYCCFHCNCELTNDSVVWDHTLPLVFGYPMLDKGTPMCATCNGHKGDKWPKELYSVFQLKRLSKLTKVPYEVLSGNPHHNPHFIQALSERYNELLRTHSSSVEKYRKRILNIDSIDVALLNKIDVASRKINTLFD